MFSLVYISYFSPQELCFLITKHMPMFWFNFQQSMQIIVRGCVTLHISIYSYLCPLSFYEWHDIWLPEFFRSDIAFCGKNSLHSRRSKRTSSYNFFLQYTKTDFKRGCSFLSTHSTLVTDYIQTRRGHALLFSFE